MISHDSKNTFVCKSTINSVESALACAFLSEDSTYLTIEFSEYCAGSEAYCAAGTEL